MTDLRRPGDTSKEFEYNERQATEETLDAVKKATETARDALLNEQNFSGRQLTYQLDIGVVAAGAGYAAEIYPTGARVIYITEVHLNKPSVNVTLRLIKASTRSTGGTSTTPTPTALDSTQAVSQATVKLFTAVPTAGTAIGDLFDLAMATGDVVWQEFGNNNTKPLVLRGSGDALAVNVSAAATIAGYIRWVEV